MKTLSRTFLSLLSALCAALFSLAFIQSGRLDIQISYVFFAIAIWTVVENSYSDTAMTPRHILLTTVMLFAAALSWLPAILVGSTFIARVCYRMFVADIRRRTYSVQKIRAMKTLYWLALLAISAITIKTTSIWNMARNSSVSLKNQSLPGGIDAVFPIVIYSILAGAIWWVIQTSDVRRFETIDSLLVSLIGVPVFLLISSYFLEPHRPTEGVLLNVYLAVALTILPLTFLLLGNYFSKEMWLGRKVVGVLVAASFLVIALYPQVSNTKLFGRHEHRMTTWASLVLAEYMRAPKRPVACLNTTLEDVTGDAEAQRCTQMSFRLAGFISPIYEYWGEATGCSSSTNSLNTMTPFPREMLANLTLILTDPSRTSSMAGCQSFSNERSNGWLTDVEWPYVRKINIRGVEVFPKPTQPGT